MDKRFDSDTAALREREQLNAQGALHDLEEWIIDQVRPVPGMRVLDLGCGTGKQIFALAPLVLPGGEITGLDISAEAVAAVLGRAREEGWRGITARRAALEDCLNLFPSERFDLILSAYAIYYAPDMRGLLAGLVSLLRPRGRVFVCGPGQGTNRELIDLANGLLASGAAPLPAIGDFVGDDVLASLRGSYTRVVTSRLPNRIRFSSPESLLRWWRNHNSYRRELDEAVGRRLKEHFDRQGEFLLSKHVLGVRCHA